VRHFLASCSKDAVAFETSVTIDIAGEAFRTTGAHENTMLVHCWVQEGWAAVIQLASSNPAYLPRHAYAFSYTRRPDGY
jgi:DNA topoisomerase-3